jgi:hypothetical protein
MNDSDDNANNDFEYARQTYHELIANGSNAIEEMMEVARNTEHPRAFEVLSQMMKHQADINGSLLAMHKKKKEYFKEEEVQKLTHQTNNLFVGSTTDLQRMLKDAKNNMKENDNVIDITTRVTED